MALALYRLFLLLFSPVIVLLILWRLVRGREDAAHFGQRLGKSRTPRPQGPLAWFHGASVGEVTSLMPVLKTLRQEHPTLNLLLTTGTRTGHATLHRLTRQLEGTGHIIICYVPLDFRFTTRRFMAHWHPTLSVFAESEFWPNLLAAAPHPILLNGRVSDRSWPKYQRHRWFFRPLITRFEKILAQREEDALRLKAIGAREVEVGGNLKFDADPLPADDTQLEKLQAHIGRRPLLVAASTHQGEEEILAQVHMQLKSRVPNLLTVIVPRHPHRGTQAVNAVLRVTRAVARRGLGELPHHGGPRHTDIYVADTLGELGLWYRLADLAFIGGTLVRVGGHNPLEPLKLGVPVISGPHMFNFKDMTPLLVEKKLLTIASDATDLSHKIGHFLQHPTEGIKQRTLIARLMPQLGGASNTAARYLGKRLAELADEQKEKQA